MTQPGGCLGRSGEKRTALLKIWPGTADEAPCLSRESCIPVWRYGCAGFRWFVPIRHSVRSCQEVITLHIEWCRVTAESLQHDSGSFFQAGKFVGDCSVKSSQVTRVTLTREASRIRSRRHDIKTQWFRRAKTRKRIRRFVRAYAASAVLSVREARRNSSAHEPCVRMPKPIAPSHASVSRSPPPARLAALVSASA